MLSRFRFIAGSLAIVFCLVLAVTLAFDYGQPVKEQGKQTNSRADEFADSSVATDVEVLDQVATSQLPYESQYGSLVSSLKGIYFDRDLAVDDLGNLRISSDIKDIFDFFFSAIEEEDLEIVLGRIEEYLSYKLEDPALSQALTALAQYVEYKAALVELELAFSDRIAEFAGSDSADVSSGAYLALVEERSVLERQLRQEHLSSELHEAFYQDREVYDSYMLQKLKIQADSTLTSEQKVASLALLDQQMPAEFIESRNAANPVEPLRQATQQQGLVDEEALYTRRVEVVGEPAAKRLSELDKERAQWSERYDQYGIQRDSILNNNGLSQETQLAEVELLRQRMFNETERLRVAALDQVNQVF
jgi:lipase chaperone LimK